MQLPVKVKACVMVQPGYSVLPESDSPPSYTDPRYAVCMYIYIYIYMYTNSS